MKGAVERWRVRLGAALCRIAAKAPAGPGPSRPRDGYDGWIARFGSIGAAERAHLAARLQARLGTRRMLFSVLMAVDEKAADAFAVSLESLREQIYAAWELCVAAPAGLTVPDHAAIRRTVAEQPRLRDAWASVRGEFVVVLEPGDRLSPAALAVAALAFADAPGAAFLYSDEDRTDELGGRRDPWFKGGWNPDLFMAQAYALRMSVMRRHAVEHAGGVDGPDGAEHYATLLRLAGAASAREAVHLPFVLYHRRADAPRDEPAAHAQALSQHLAASEPEAVVEGLPRGGWRRVVWPVPAGLPTVSLCIPTRDRVALLSACVEGLRHRTDWPALEILIVDNGSVEAETHAYMASLAGDPRVRVLREVGPFNFSRLNNLGAAMATGSLFGLINNDIVVREPGWLREMAGHALRPDVGAVGALLHYGDGTVQHAGVVLGIGGVGSHVHKRLAPSSTGYHGRVVVTQEVTVVTAACLLTRHEVYRALDGLDEQHLPVAYNDVDFCLRLREAGLRIVFTPHARLYHLESASRGRDDGGARRERLERDKAWMRARWGADLAADPFYSPNLALDATDCRLTAEPRIAPPWLADMPDDARNAVAAGR